VKTKYFCDHLRTAASTPDDKLFTDLLFQFHVVCLTGSADTLRNYAFLRKRGGSARSHVPALELLASGAPAPPLIRPSPASWPSCGPDDPWR
jgi:hypothetical protein